ncbi:MAG: hypothetical protein GX751_10625 [Desulfuromonadaceae bacterium]|nr:hypothetical protein [Desulfuromonadaceae bacterium]
MKKRKSLIAKATGLRVKNCFLILSTTAFLILSSSNLLLSAASAEYHGDPAKITLERFNSPAGQFSVSIPSGWSRIESYPYKMDDTVTGIMIEGPENMEGAPMTMAVLHYAGSGWIKGVDHYIKMILATPTRLDGEKATEFSDVNIAGIKGTTFTFKKFHLVVLPFRQPPMENGVIYEMKPPTRKVAMVVRHLVLPAKPGFYSLWFEVPEDRYSEFSGTFDRVVKSFSCQGK